MCSRRADIFYCEESPANASAELKKINEEVRRRIVDKVVKDIPDNREVQTPIHTVIECVCIATPKTSLVFVVRNVQDVGARTVQEVLKEQAVNMIYMKRKYSNRFRVMGDNSSDEVGRSGEIELESNE